jgi:hypothetical protein
MKTSFLQPLWVRHLVIVCAILLSCPAFASDRFRIPPPPPPRQVVEDIRGFIHRVADGVKNASKRTWGAVRDRFSDDDDEEDPAPPRRSSSRRRTVPPLTEEESFARSKDAVPYRYDDAEAVDPSRYPDTKSFTIPRGPSEEMKPSQFDPRKSFTTPTPDANADPARQAPLPERRSAEGKVVPPRTIEDIQFARPVPGKPGVVYPPGAKDSKENMVDVAGFQTGQLVRDPRTGKLFRVP